MATLEEFLKDYIKTQKAQRSKESFDTWWAKYGGDAIGGAAKAMSRLETGYAKSRQGYGAGAERLADMGLIGSGYGEYLGKLSKKTLIDGKREIGEDYAKDIRENERLYGEYSEKYDNDIEKLQSSVTEDIRKSGTIDYDTAYLFAINAGLPDEEAMLAAKSGSELAKSAAKASVYNAIINKHLNSSEALELSLGLGFSEKEARELSEFAKIYRGYRYQDDGLSYSEYLRQKLKEQKEKGEKIF